MNSNRPAWLTRALIITATGALAACATKEPPT
jgi:hypothetical protein